jgi:hypothetical protein
MRIANRVDDPKGVFEPFGETLAEVDTGSIAFQLSISQPTVGFVRCDMKLYMCRSFYMCRGKTVVDKGD